MTDSQSSQDTGGEAQQEAPPPDSSQDAHTEADFHKLLAQVRTLGNQLLDDLAALAHAQWRLTSHIVVGSARIWGIRLATFVVIAVLALASWILLNVTVWQVVGEYCPVSYAPTLILFLLNFGSALLLFLWQKGLRLQ
jgi:hypothetical protein